ncbi:hypothetical protein D3C77_234680 [compost metagenome]
MNDDEQASRQYPIKENMPLQRRVWRFERIGWYVLLLIVSVALAGAFGNGPLSRGEVVSQDERIRVSYQRLSRSGTRDNLQITVRAAPSEQVTLILGGALFREASIETMQPQPEEAASQRGDIALHLGADAEGLATLYLVLRTDHVGTLEGHIGLGSSSALHVSTFYYP